MKSQIDCIHCYQKQVVSAMQLANIPEDKQRSILYALMDDIRGFDCDVSPAENSTYALLRGYELMGIDDPYAEAKKQANDMVLSLLPRLKESIAAADDPLHAALKLSIAGNIIDLGIQRSFDIEGAIRQCMELPLAQDDYAAFLEKLKGTKRVLIVGDNTGEIVFDRLVAEQLTKMGKEVIFMVRSGPVINDALLSDSHYVGMDQVATVVESGSRMVGVLLKLLSEEARTLLLETPVILSKGQGNFETLEGEEAAKGRVFFLLRIKCPDVARYASAMAHKPIAFGDVVFMLAGI